jgi:glycosyltransferase involved in cell wall biosynthesis
LRVVHWFPNFLAGGGVANSVLALANAQSRAGSETSIVSLSSERSLYGTQQLEPEVAVIAWKASGSVPLGGLRMHRMARSDAQRLKALSPDVVHVHAEFNPDNWRVASLWSGPIVLSPHGAFHAAVISRGARSKAAYRWVAQRRLYRRVTSFHALSPAEERDLRQAVPDAASYIAPQGPSPAVDAWLKSNSAGGPERASGPVTFMFVGRLDVDVKGLDLLIEGFSRAAGSAPSRDEARLILIGPDWNGGKARLLELSSRWGIQGLVEIRDGVSASEVPALLGSCDVYVQLSRNEGSPLSLNDALALGKPVIVSDRIGTVSSAEISRLPHVTVISPSATEAEQAITAALHDVGRLRRDAAESLPTISSLLSWEAAASTHLRAYRRLVSTASTRTGLG